MRKLIVPLVLVMLLLTVLGEAFAQTATVVTRSGQIARIYLLSGSGYDAEGRLYGSGESSGFDPYEQRGIFDGGYASRVLSIPSEQTWTDTGISVTRGQRIHFRASGTIRLSENGDDYGTPAGANSGRLAGNSPLPNVTGGMLIGRVGRGRPFVIGAETEITSRLF
jgi:hypothetical protein